MTCSYSVHKWCWNWVHGCEPDQHVEWVSLRWRFFFYTLCIDIVVAFSAQDINYSGDSYWKGLATHLSNFCYGMLQEGQCILHVGWISQVENIVSTEGCKCSFFNSYSPAHLHTINFDNDLKPFGESHFPVSFYQLYGWVWSISIRLWEEKKR